MFVLPFTFALLLAQRSLAIPSFVEKRSIGGQSLRRLNLMQEYASSTYCKNNFNSSGDRIKCNKNLCPMVEAAGTTSLLEFSSGTTGLSGYVGSDPTNKIIVLAVSGSLPVNSWLANFSNSSNSTGLCDQCNAQSSFWKSWTESRSAITEALKKLTQSFPNHTIAAVGHSIGGAVASLATAQLRKDGFNVTLYTFGAPRFASSKLSQLMSNQGNNYRFTHWNDPVPRVPPEALGYAHIMPEYYINAGNYVSVGESDVKIVSNTSLNIGNSVWRTTDIVAHTWYFSTIGIC